MNGESGGAFALGTKLLHPGPKAMGVEQQSAVLETGRNFRFLALVAPCRSQSECHLACAARQQSELYFLKNFMRYILAGIADRRIASYASGRLSKLQFPSLK